MARPIYQINERVYLRSTCLVGRLESYLVSNVYNKGAGYIYGLKITQKPPREAAVGDGIDLKSPRELYFPEAELLSACQALPIAIVSLQNRIDRLTAVRTDACEEEQSEVETVSRPDKVQIPQPKFEIGDKVYYRSSAIIGFLHGDHVTHQHWEPNLNEWQYQLDIRGDFREKTKIKDPTGNTPGFIEFEQLTIKPDRRPGQTNPQNWLTFRQYELLNLCEAATFAVAPLERQLTKLQSEYASVCEGS